MKEKSHHILLITFIAILMSLIGNLSFELIANNHIPDMLKTLSSYLYIFLIPITMFAVFGFMLFNKFLDKNKDSKNDGINKKVEEFESELKKLAEIKLASTLKISEEEKKDLIIKLNQQFEENITSEYLINLENKIKINNLEEITDVSISRIKREIRYVRLTGNFQLYIGILLSIVAIALIAEKVFFTNTIYSDIHQLAIETLPRAFLLIFIEIFSFFFLNLYKKSLDDIKYLNNELTNLENKFLALYLAKDNGNFKLLSNALETLLKTERNFVLKKDETTIELEKNKIEAQSSNSTLQALKDIINLKR